ncbi:guanylate cyclase, putative [Bodo saltans]|uniref:Guanylate cyclase, putative n=1 Tax=Bodo saltans TaxID=75058 RepID=A0A0S4JCY9_BODSA|nr:guanylate cyclase, putative [Bodo saltans]|eukprot:CUG86156.1 guanylate cyclase, putative [Bodo saltans]
MHHHRFQPLLIFASSMLIVVLGISVAMWTYRPTESLSVIWNVLLGAIVAVVATIVVAIRLFDRDRDGNARSSSAGGSDSSANHKKKSRSNELWSARVAEFCAWALQIAAIWGTLSAYSYVAATCYHTQVFYVPWIKGCVNTTERASATLRPSHFFHEDHRCPAIEYYCERSMYSFVVPAIFTAVILFRPRAILGHPTIASAPFAFAASRQVTSDAMDVDSESVFWSKLILICAFCIFGIAVKIALEREQRRRFRAYATLYHQLSQYVRHREALADFLDAKLPPILRSRLLNGNVSLDSSQLATCIMFDLAEYPTWCTRMMPLAAATSVAQLHDVISARSAAAGVEKIRAFGDVFVGASNLAVESPHHAALCCQLALQIFSDAFEFRAAFAAPLALRCGLHSGTLIGLVLGATYRRYDIFGDAIATASRVLDVTQGNQIVLTDTTAEEAQEFAIMAPRGDEQQQPGSQGGAATEITSPFTRRTHPLFVLTSLRKLVPTCEAYVALLQENVNHKERACRQKKQWATNMSRARDDALVEVAATLASDIPLHEIIVKSSQEDVRMLSASDSSRHESYVVPRIPTEGGRVDGVPPLPPPSLQHQQQQQRSPQQRATFEVVASKASSPQHLQAATKQRGPRSSLIPFDRPHQPLYDPTELRDYVVLHNSSTKMLEKAIQDSRLKQECGPLLKRFVLNLHELEFSLSYLRAADRVPYVVSLVALAMLYVTMIALSLYEAHYFPPQVEGLLNTTLIDLNRDLNDGGAVVGAILLAIAAAVSLGTACVVQLAPNFISENSMIMWLLACANCSFAYFGAAVSAPGVVGSDATYLFWFSITTLHFGSWNFSGLVLITVVSLGVFLAATNTITGTYLPIWTLPMLFIASTLNMYFDRNRERRLREMYRDLFLTKAASKAVEGEGHVRRSVLRATIPRPLMPLATDVASQGRLLTTSLTESIVMHIRLDTINEDVITSLMRQCDQKMVGLRRDGSALSQIATALLPGGIAASPVDPLGGSGRRFPPSEDSPSPRGANIAHALAAVEESSSIIETLLNSMTGTELAMVQIFGDDVTIAGPLEEEDTRGLPTGQPTRPPVGVGEELGGGNGGVEQGDGRATTSRKQNLEARVQRAAYDTMLLIAQLYRLQSRLRKHASMSSSVGTSASSPRGREDAELLETPLGESGNMQSSSHRTFGFSAVCVCDTIINVLANGEYPSYDLLGSASYFSRVLMQQLPQRGCIATERFVQYYQEEIRAAAAAEGIMIPNTMLGFAGRPEECSTAKFQTTTLPTNSGGSHDPPPPAVAASSSGSPPRVEGASGSLAVGSGSSPTTDGVGGGGGGEVDSDEWATTPAPQPRVGEVERWRVRGLGTLWVYPILPGLE